MKISFFFCYLFLCTASLLALDEESGQPLQALQCVFCGDREPLKKQLEDLSLFESDQSCGRERDSSCAICQKILGIGHRIARITLAAPDEPTVLFIHHQCFLDIDIRKDELLDNQRPCSQCLITVENRIWRINSYKKFKNNIIKPLNNGLQCMYISVTMAASLYLAYYFVFGPGNAEYCPCMHIPGDSEFSSCNESIHKGCNMRLWD